MKSKSLASKLCSCIKKVRSKVTLRKGSKAAAAESAAIGICVKSVLKTRGRTLKKFRCRRRPMLQTKPL